MIVNIKSSRHSYKWALSIKLEVQNLRSKLQNIWLDYCVVFSFISYVFQSLLYHKTFWTMFRSWNEMAMTLLPKLKRFHLIGIGLQEGEFASISVKRLRKRQMQNFFVSLMVSQVKLTICYLFYINSCSKLFWLILCTLNYDTVVEAMSSKY